MPTASQGNTGLEGQRKGEMAEKTEKKAETGSPGSGREWKEAGNEAFKGGSYQKAVSAYKKGLDIVGENKEERLTLFKNLAAVYLKLDNHKEALSCCSSALELCPHDIKGLFRRCQAYEGLEKYHEAFKDAILVQRLEPNNNPIKPIIRRLNIKVQDIAKEQTSTSSRVKTMLKYLTDPEIDSEKREQAVSNLMVLAREDGGAEMILNCDGIKLLRQSLDSQVDHQMQLSSIRVISELCKKSVKRTLVILESLGIDYLLDLMVKNPNEESITSLQYTVQTVINSLVDYDPKESKKPDSELLSKHGSEIDKIMTTLVKRCSSRVMNAFGRDAILELLMKNVDYDVLNWGSKLIEAGALLNLLEVAGELEDVKYESSMEVTRNTRTHVALVLERIYNGLDHDKAREAYRELVMAYINGMLKGPDIENKVHATSIITALLQGPVDVGNYCLAQQGIVEMMLLMADSEADEIQQRVAAEAIIAAASKKDKCSSIATMGASILKKLYQSPNDGIKVRALVGLCKVGSVGGTDASIRPFSDGSVHKLVAACKKFLTNPTKSRDLKKWAAEGYAYLTLDADVKESVINDPETVNGLIELARTGDLSVLYGVITTFVNLTNSYDKQEIMPEMLELAKYSKQHVPEAHPKDSKEYVDKRCEILGKMNITSALVSLSKSESKTSLELICRVFDAICEHKHLRGNVVQNGGVKALLKMATENNTAPGKLEAGQALARIGITINPEVAFPGQRAAEVVRPIAALLHPECNALQNFECLMALTNLAQVGPSIQGRILKDGGFAKIESFMFESHELLKRAATQCVVNLIVHPEVVKAYEGDNDRVKYLVLLCQDDDMEIAAAAAGGLAMLTSVSPKACKKVFDTKRWHEILMMLSSSQDKELQHRGIYIVHNLINAEQEVAEKIVETCLLEVLMAVTRPEVDDISDKVKQLARDALDKAKEYKLIKSTNGQANENEEDPD